MRSTIGAVALSHALSQDNQQILRASSACVLNYCIAAVIDTLPHCLSMHSDRYSAALYYVML
jgi:hypothetical protein